MKRMKILVCVALFFGGAGCKGEWDVPVTARVDPCTGAVEKQVVYFMPVCMRPPATGPQR